MSLRVGDRLKGNNATYEIVAFPTSAGGRAVTAFGRAITGGRGIVVGQPVVLKVLDTPVKRTAPKHYVAMRRSLDERLEKIPSFVSQQLDFFVETETDHFVSVWERVPGKPLPSTLATGPKFETRLLWATTLVYALRKLHECGIAHLDLKPDNCYIEHHPRTAELKETYTAKLIDFDDALVDGFPYPSEVTGTEGYASPEHFFFWHDGSRRPQKPADVFATGIILYEILCGRRPFSDGDPTAFVVDAGKRPPDPTALESHVGEPVGAIMRDMLVVDPAKRPTIVQVHEVLLDKRPWGTATPPVPPAKLETKAEASKTPVGTATDAPSVVGTPGPAPTTASPAALVERLVLSCGAAKVQLASAETLQLTDHVLPAGFKADPRTVLGTVGRIYRDSSQGWVVFFTRNARYKYPRLDGKDAALGTALPLAHGTTLSLSGLHDIKVAIGS